MASIMTKVRERTSRSRASWSLEEVVRGLKTVLRGCGNYFRHRNSNRTSNSIDHYILLRLARLAGTKYGLRGINWASRFTDADFVADEILSRTCETAGSDDFGPAGWKEGFEILLGDLNDRVQLTGLGRLAIRELITASLTTRLSLVNWAKEHPEVLERRVESPIIIVGTARAGTTLLSYLLDQDDRFRSLLAWEVSDPVPPPHAEELRSGPRVEAGRRGQELLQAFHPSLRTIHHEDPNGPTECIGLLAQHFMSIVWLFGAAPTYSKWLINDAKYQSAYEYHHLALQVLQAHTSSHWSLKAIQHAIALDALTLTYPDARLLILHRDPVAVLASACSLVQSTLTRFTTAEYRDSIASTCLDYFEAGVIRSAKFIDTHPTWPIVEVRYDDLVGDPLATVRRIYEEFDEPLRPSVEKKMRAWLLDHPQGKFGRHRYSLSAFGLDRGEIEDRFSTYRERYDLGHEAVPD